MRPIEPEEFAEASRKLLASLEPHRLPHQRRRGSERWEATHVLRVRVVSCPDCSTRTSVCFLNPWSLWRHEPLTSATDSLAAPLVGPRVVVPEAWEEADGKQRCTVYNTLGVTVWVAKTKGDPIRTVFSALGGEEVCRSDATSTR
jgi:hypothetical protein